jgi:hypothetical protein
LNEKIFKESKGKPLHYGDKVQLIHVESQAYVSVSRTYNKQDKGLLNLELITEGNTRVYFEVMPAVGYLQYGDLVTYDTPLFFISDRNKFCLTKGPQLDMTKVRAEINPEKNVLTRSAAEFPPVMPRRPEALFENKIIYNAGVKLTDKFQAAILKRYTTHELTVQTNANNAYMNGDYVRILQDRDYLTIYPGSNPGECMYTLQSTISNEYNYNYAYSLFQVILAPEIDELPKGFIIENDSKRTKKSKYLIRHVATGLFLHNDNGKLTLAKREDLKDILGVNLFIKNLSQNALDNEYIDKGSVLQLLFTSPGQAADGKSRFSLRTDVRQEIDMKPNVSTKYFYGFKLQDDYLNKWIRPDRNLPVVQDQKNDEATSFRFISVDDSEVASFNFVESFANRVNKFIDFLFDFTAGDQYKIKDVNDRIKQLTKACKEFKRELYNKTESGGL